MNLLKPSSESPVITALVVLRAGEGQQLIGRAVAQLPEIQEKKQSGRMVIVGGTTTRYVAWQLTGKDPGKEAFTVGWIRDGKLGETSSSQRGEGPLLFEGGILSRGWPGPLLERFETGDIYIKGANAIDDQGNASILLGSPTGGSIGVALAILRARGGRLIVPVSLQKRVPSVSDACALMGQGCVDRVMGTPVGCMPLMKDTFTLVTEIQAFRLLFGVQATLVASGGVDDCVGAMVFHLVGSKQSIELCFQTLESSLND